MACSESRHKTVERISAAQDGRERVEAAGAAGVVIETASEWAVAGRHGRDRGRKYLHRAMPSPYLSAGNVFSTFCD